jgi:AAHS family benzoate transporter-like MFS transporter
MDSPEMTRKRRSTVVWVVTLSCLGMIFDGYDLVVYGAVLPLFLQPNGLAEGVTINPATGGLLGSYALFGMLFGALIAGTLSDKLGRRKVMLVSFAWLSVGMFVTALMTTVGGFGLFRFLTGLAVGSMVATVGAMVAEVAPPGKKNLCNAIVYSGVPLGSLLSALLAIILLPLIGWRGMFMLGALPLVTLLPLGLWKMPESVAWLASRGKMEEAHRLSAKTGVPVPAPVGPAAEKTPARSRDERSGWAGLFSVFLVPTIILGLVAAMSLTLVYSLNTWLPALMKPVMGQNASLALLLVLNGGAILGALFGSGFADRFGPQRVVAACFLIGAVSIGLVGVIASTLPETPGPGDIAGLMLALTLAVIAVVGVGTSGTQTLLYGLVSNYYPTNVRGAGVAWAAGFGRLGGVGGPILGGFLAAAFATDLHLVFYILAGFAVAGMILILMTPRPKREAVAEQLEPTVAPSPAAVAAAADKFRLYDTIMVVVDETGNQLTRDRVSEFVSLTGHKVHLVYLAPERVIGGEVSGLADGSNDVDINPRYVANLQEYVDQVSQRGVPVTGQVLTATLFGRSDALVDLAHQLRADLLILNTEVGGQRAKAHLAEAVATSDPKMAVLIARSTQDLPVPA